MKFLRLIVAAAIGLFFSSCAQKWDVSQKTALSSVSVDFPFVATGAYHKPLGKMLVEDPPVAGIASGDAFSNAITQLAVEGIGKAQQSMFEKSNQDAMSRISGTLPDDLAKRLKKAVVMELDANSFFRGKIRESSPNRLALTVESYGYVRIEKVNGKILMAPQMTGTFELFDAKGVSLLRQKSMGFTESPARPLEDFANDRKLASRMFDEMVRTFAQQVSAAVDLKAGLTKN